MKEVHIGVIGCGVMAQSHMKTFESIERLRFTAASDVSADNLGKAVQTYGVEAFEDAGAMLDSGLIDAVLIATPHYFHPRYAIAAFERGLHVLTEKPVAVTAKAAAGVNARSANHPNLRYATMFQYRTSTRWRRVKELIDTGRLGSLQRMHWICTDWLRTQTYFNGGGWRATWAGEGGGVLINQTPHNLDMICWLLGTPTRVHAHLGLGKYHDIEVEDEVTAYLEFAAGVTGVFIASTGEAPGTDVLSIVGTRGRLTIDAHDALIRFDELEEASDEYIRTSPERFRAPAFAKLTIEPPPSPVGHVVILRNFVAAILDGDDLIAPGIEGLNSLELANAITMSGLTNRAVDIPTDRDAYERLLQELIENKTQADSVNKSI